MIVHLVDGTYELFRHFYGIRRGVKTDPKYGAVAGVLYTIAQMIDGAKRKGLIAGVHGQIHRAERPTPRAIHERRRFGRRGGWIRLLGASV